MSDVITVVVTGLLTGVGGSFLAGWWQRSKTKSDAAKSAAEAVDTEATANDKIRATVMLLLDPLKDEICELQKEVAANKSEIGLLRDWAERLSNQVKKLGGVPEPYRFKQDKDS